MLKGPLPRGVSKGVLDIAARHNHGVLHVGDKVRLARGRVHEIQGNSSEVFALIVASGLKGSVFWIGQPADIDSLSPTGIQLFLDPGRLITVKGGSRLEVLWAMEVALRTDSNVCVIAEIQNGPDLRESRRLQLACEDSGALGLVLISGRTQNSAAETRWQCDTVLDDNMAWLWRCTRNRRGGVGSWRVTWQEGENGTGVAHLVAATVN